MRDSSSQTAGTHQTSAPQAAERSSPVLSAVLLVVDLVLVILFAAAGNRSHETGLSAGDIASTAAPFMLALLVATLVTPFARRPSRLWPDGLVVVVITVGMGMALRVGFDSGGTQLSFILVATGVLGALLLGRRLMTGLIRPATK